MEINEFVQKFAEQFDDTPASVFSAQTRFRELDEWSSFMALCVMVMIGGDYDVNLSAAEMRSAQTVQELFDIVKSKQNEE